MTRYTKLYQPNSDPVTEKARPEQVVNSTGGHTFALTPMEQLARFLILGSDAPTYYASAQNLTRDNAKVVEACWTAFPLETGALIAKISDENRAPKNGPAIFALALGMISQNVHARTEAYKAAQKVCRTATHLFTLLRYARELGKGNGRGNKRMIATWYNSRPTSILARQMVQYQNREGFTHKRAIQLSNMGAGPDVIRQALYAWACGREHDEGVELPAIVTAMKAAHEADVSTKKLVQLITDHNLPWEAVPTEALRQPEIWEALLPKMGLTAMIRNLGRMTEVGTIGAMNSGKRIVMQRLDDLEGLKKGRIHPFTLLQALAVYKGGTALHGGRRGVTKTWTPVSGVIDALDSAFYKAFEAVIPTGKRHLLALDVSGSMGSSFAGSPLTCREGTAAMAMITQAVEAETCVFGFSSRFIPLDIGKRKRLDDVVRVVSGLPFSNTDCSLPMIYATEHKLAVDAFVVYTDNECNSGAHPFLTLEKYRQKTGINAKLIVVGMTATKFSIANPSDPGMLDVVGFDSSAPAVMADFVR